MWSFASSAIAGKLGPKSTCSPCNDMSHDCSDDEVSSCSSKEEVLECPICWESFNIVENVPYVLWCGHTLCKNCVMGLQWAVVKFPTVPIQLPFFISCPWCNLLSLRFVYKGNLTFPRKNYFLLWMVESMNGDRAKSHSDPGEQHSALPSSTTLLSRNNSYHFRNNQRDHYRNAENLNGNEDIHGLASNYLNADRINASLRKSLAFFLQLTAKFPLVLVFLLIVLYAIPASAAILALYVLVTVLFAVPSFLILYFAYPSLDWLVREIFT